MVDVFKWLRSGIRDRCEREVLKKGWSKYKSNTPNIKKVRYKLEHEGDGWGCACFKNGSDLVLKVTVSVQGQNIGRSKIRLRRPI